MVLDESAEALRDGLQRFVFRSKVRLLVRDDLGAFAEKKVALERATPVIAASRTPMAISSSTSAPITRPDN